MIYVSLIWRRGKEIERQIDTEADRKADKQAQNRQTDKHTNRQRIQGQPVDTAEAECWRSQVSTRVCVRGTATEGPE